MEGTKIINNTLMDVDSEGNVLGNHIELDEDLLFDCFIQKVEYEYRGVVSELRRMYDRGEIG